MSTLSKVKPSLVDDDFLEGSESCVQVHGVQSTCCCLKVEAHELALCWGTGTKAAEKTLEATTLSGGQSVIPSLHCRYQVEQ